METRTSWHPPEGGGAPLLCMPTVPLPLHKLAPRTIMGEYQWGKYRKQVYEEHEDTCEICGVACGIKRGEPNMRQAHEVYALDYNTRTSTFVRACCLCAQCVDEETEVLTSKGWVKIPQVTTEDLVACWSADGLVEFRCPTYTITTAPSEAIEIKNRRSTLYFSPEHRLPLRVAAKHSPTYGQIVDVLAKDYKPSHYYNWPTGGHCSSLNNTLSYNERIYIAIEADGHLKNDKEHPHGNEERKRKRYVKAGSSEERYTYTIRLKKKRKIKRMLWLLQRGTLSYKLYDRNNGYVEFIIWTDVECKHFANCFELKMNSAKAGKFLDELLLWDGARGSTDVWHTSKREEADFVQAIAAQCGRLAYIGEVNRIGQLRKGDYPTPYTKVYYAITIRKKHTELCARELKSRVIKWDKPMYCLTVPTGYFIARRDGQVFATGNCHRAIHSGRQLICYQNHEPWWTTEVMLGIARHAFELVHKWNKLHTEKLKMFSGIHDWLEEPSLHDELQTMIDVYAIEFYAVPPTDTPEDWGKWKLIYNDTEYWSPYQSAEEWAEGMGVKDEGNLFEGDVFAELRANIGK